MQVKPTTIYDIIPIRMTVIKKDGQVLVGMQSNWVPHTLLVGI